MLHKAACKRTQQLPTLLRKQCWELLRACWQWCANGCNNSQQCWDLQCIVGRILPISLCKPCVMSVRGPKNVVRAVQTDPTLLRYASAITERMKCWELLAEMFDWFQTLRNNRQQHPTTCNRVCKRTQHVTSNNVGGCWSTMLRPFARSLRSALITQGLQRLMGCILPTMHCTSQHCWELLHPLVHHCQHACNNSQHCWRNNVGSCCVRLHAALFCTFLCRHFAHYVKVPNFTLCGGRKHKTVTFFFFSSTSIQFFRRTPENFASI